MKVAIVGSRGMTDYQVFKDLITPLFTPEANYTTIVTGGAKGVDSMAMQLAEELALNLIVHKPQWSIHGKGAGIRRNELIVKDADAVIAFWDGKSKGTKHTIDYSAKNNVITKVLKI